MFRVSPKVEAMMSERTRAWSVVLLVAAMAGCGATTPPTPDAGPGDAGDNVACTQSYDCPDQVLFFCSRDTHRCEPGCLTREDCSAERRGTHPLAWCSTAGGGLGCQCDEGLCVPSLCASDADCSGQVCRNGACTAAPPASAAASCVVTPELVVLQAGARVRFTVAALDAAGAPVVIPAGAIWTAVTGGPLSGGGGGASAVFTAATATSAAGESVAAVQAVVGAATCVARAVVLPAAVPPSQVWAVVTDELSGRPVTGIQVALSDDDGGVLATATTDARGLASLAPAALPPLYSVTAFGPDHDYLTVAGYRGAARALALVTRRNAVDAYGGFAGAYSQVPTSLSDAHFGLAGASLPGSITSFSLAQLLGPSVPTDVVISGVIDQRGVPIPAGLSLGFGVPPIKPGYAALGLAGTCLDDAGAPDEGRISAGSCGTRAAWSLNGDIPVTTLFALAGPLTGGGATTSDLSGLLGPLISSLKRFNSSVARDVPFSLRPTPLDDAGQPSFLDQRAFTPLDLPYAQVPLAFHFAARLPDLPRYRGAYASAALLLGGVDLAGRGLVPLGLGAGTNADGDARTDRQDPYPGPGLVQVHMAPAHHGLEGAEYVVLATAVTATGANDAGLTDAAAASGASGILARLPGNSLSYDPAGTRPVDLSGGGFPALPEGARFNFNDPADPDGIPPRSFRFIGATPPALSGAAVVRVAFTDDQSHRWVVVADGSRAGEGFRLPVPPSTADRLYAHGLASGERSTLVVETQRLDSLGGADGGVALGFGDVVELGAPGAATGLVTGFSFLAYGRPAVRFTAPGTTPATVAPLSRLTLLVTGFKLGTAGEGVVGLTFSPATACPAEVVLSQETSPGNGALEYVLPAGCSGAVTVRAELRRPDGHQPITPGVATSVQLTIQ
jgi:hypothetical protein